MLTSRRDVGVAARRIGVFVTPEEAAFNENVNGSPTSARATLPAVDCPEDFMRALMVALIAAARSRCHAAAAAQTVEKLYVMDCGHNAATDQARWSPGVNVGKPIELSDNCYLIKHGAQWLLWDTGYPDAVADKPLTSPIGTATRPKKLAAQLAEIGVKPDDITLVAVSHTHGDHVGNVDMFPQSTLLIQKAEVDWAFADGKHAAVQEGPADEARSPATSTCSATAAPSSCRRPATRRAISRCSCTCRRPATWC